MKNTTNINNNNNKIISIISNKIIYINNNKTIFLNRNFRWRNSTANEPILMGNIGQQFI